MSQPDHDLMVRKIIDHCNKQNFSNIKADLPNYEKPNEYRGKIPDIETYKNGERYFIEIEDCNSISTNETLEQLQEFSRGKQLSHFRFIIVVPKDCESKAENILKSNSINYDKIWLLS